MLHNSDMVSAVVIRIENFINNLWSFDRRIFIKHIAVFVKAGNICSMFLIFERRSRHNYLPLISRHPLFTFENNRREKTLCLASSDATGETTVTFELEIKTGRKMRELPRIARYDLN